MTGYIDLQAGTDGLSDGSSEEMVQIGDIVYVNLWSYNDRIAMIDTNTDKVIEERTEIGIQPYSMVSDINDCLWILCDGGGWADNPFGYEAPSLVQYNMSSKDIVCRLELPLGASVSKLCVNGIKNRLYFITNEYDANGNSVSKVCMVNVQDQYPKVKAIVTSEDKNFYSMTVSPNTEELFVADALDYTQRGIVYRYSSDGRLLGSFEAGIIPVSYAWVNK